MMQTSGPDPSAKRQVVAYFMHEEEEAAGKAILAGTNLRETASFFIANVDDATMGRLRDAGLVVKVRGQQEQVSTLNEEDPLLRTMAAEPGDAGDFGAAIRSAALAPSAIRLAPAADDAVPAVIDDYVVVVEGPLLAEDAVDLTSGGGELLQRLGLGTYRIRLKNTDVARIRSLSFVTSLTWVGVSAPTVHVDRPLSAAPAPPVGAAAPAEPAPPPTAAHRFDVKLRASSDLPTAVAWMAANGVVVVGAAGTKVRIRIDDASPLLQSIARLPYVDGIFEFVPPQLYNSHACALTGATNPSISALYDGSGETVAIADTGIDATHVAFTGRITTIWNLGRPATGDDPEGHGTHVAGIAAGDGAGSGAAPGLRGVAPKASLMVQSLLDAGGALGGLPLDLNDLFAQPYKAGARIHNNSWGAPSGAQYGINSEEVDEFVAANPDMLIVIAAGNDGRSTGTTPALPGWVDWLSVGSPATSKNGLTVGASQSDRTDGPFAGRTWNAWSAALFPSAPTSTETVTGDPQRLAAFSSRGPTLDRRIKPDLVAPATDIASTASSLATGNYDAVVKDPAGAPLPYAFLSGTSMAAPHVAGCAALVRQFYRTKKGYATPSAALIKATLVGGTTWLTGADACAPTTGEPNYHQGHGRVDLSMSVEHDAYTIVYDDDWKQGSGLVNTGDRKRWQVTLPANGPLRVCMAYTDLPFRGLQNDLNLVVQLAGSVQKFIGNAGLPDGLTQPDSTNNLELVRLDNAVAGIYYIQVMASNLLKGPQTFALFVGGNRLTGFTPY